MDIVTYIVLTTSGLRVTLTTNLRPNEAGMLELGHLVNHYQIVPPGEADFITHGHCHELCLKEVKLDCIVVWEYVRCYFVMLFVELLFLPNLSPPYISLHSIVTQYGKLSMRSIRDN